MFLCNTVRVCCFYEILFYVSCDLVGFSNWMGNIFAQKKSQFTFNLCNTLILIRYANLKINIFPSRVWTNLYMNYMKVLILKVALLKLKLEKLYGKYGFFKTVLCCVCVPRAKHNRFKSNLLFSVPTKWINNVWDVVTMQQ